MEAFWRNKSSNDKKVPDPVGSAEFLYYIKRAVEILTLDLSRPAKRVRLEGIVRPHLYARGFLIAHVFVDASIAARESM
jgi:hypothetical protein